MHKLTPRDYDYLIRGPDDGNRDYFEIRQGVLTSKTFLGSLYFRDSEMLERDISFLVENALEELEIQAKDIDGVMPFFPDSRSFRGSQSEMLSSVAERYLNSLNDCKVHRVPLISSTKSPLG